KYSFGMTKKEILEFSLRAVLEQMRLQPFLWLGMLAICVLETLVERWIGIILVVFNIAMLTAVVCRSYFAMKKIAEGKTRTMWVEGGLLRIDADAYCEVPCGNIQVIRKTRNLLMLGIYRAKKQLEWYPMPLRVFSDRQDMDEFLKMIQFPMASYGQDIYSMPADDKEEVANENELFNFSFWINEEKWERILIDTTYIVRSGVLGGSKNSKVIWIIFGINLAFFICGCMFYFDIIFLSIILITLFLLVFMLKNVKGNPEKLIKRQLKKGILQSDTNGEWKVSITETGTVWNGPRQGRTVMSWDKFSLMVETETAFYLFWNDKRHYNMLLKDCIGSYEQAEALKQLCTEKNIDVSMGKKVKYIPNWVFNLLIIVLAASYILSTVRLAVRDSKMSTQENVQDSSPAYYYRSEEFNSADYPTYLPIDKQAEVLREQGLAVSDKIVEAAKDSMDEYEHMRIYVEGYPYTWLLTQMGAPDYNDEWEVIGYSDEVFWFDFEGWDISTDYITVLEGMMALAPQSAISSVTNISEDTTNVDWDKGTGSIKVSLEWNGQEYSWDMDMYYDWIDVDVLKILNSLLEQTDEEERFYVTGDDGQGAIVFYCSKEWAEEFQNATWLEMSECR
ncbi:MAG: YcxB family protein, partial [Lachnospiraceae bacterium]|nr:YcxB family protein [Lachnospiraceae bacterium]